MKFYNREKELASLEKVRQVSFSVHSQMTVLTGRRRIGKTSLIFKSCEDTPTVYLFISRSNETDLCLRFTSEIRQALDIYVPELTNFAEMFRFLMDLGTRMEYNLVIDVSSTRSAERVLQSITTYLEEKLLLKVNREKSKVSRPKESQLLGFSFWCMAKGKWAACVAPKPKVRLKEKIRRITKRNRGVSVRQITEELRMATYGVDTN